MDVAEGLEPAEQAAHEDVEEGAAHHVPAEHEARGGDELHRDPVGAGSASGRRASWASRLMPKCVAPVPPVMLTRTSEWRSMSSRTAGVAELAGELVPAEGDVGLLLDGVGEGPALICSPQSLHTPLVPTGGGEISSGGDQEHGKK